MRSSSVRRKLILGRSVSSVHPTMFRAVCALCVAAVLASAAAAQQLPNIPPPGSVPTDPVAPPQVAQPAAQPVAQPPPRPASNVPTGGGTTLPTGSAQTTGTGTNTAGQPGGTTGTTGNETGGALQTPPPARLTTKPDLDACSPALRRMLGVMFFELLVEFAFAIVRFLINTEHFDDDNDLLKLTIARAGYLLFIVPLNVSVLWLGNGMKSSCKCPFSLRFFFFFAGIHPNLGLLCMLFCSVHNCRSLRTKRGESCVRLTHLLCHFCGHACPIVTT